MSYFDYLTYRADQWFETEDEAYSYIQRNKEKIKTSYLLYRKKGESWGDFEIYNDENIAYEVYAEDISKRLNEIINEKDLNELKEMYKKCVEEDDFHYFCFFDGKKINVNPYAIVFTPIFKGLINSNISRKELRTKWMFDIEDHDSIKFMFSRRNDLIKLNIEDTMRFLTNTWDDEIDPDRSKISDIKLINLFQYFYYKETFEDCKNNEKKARKYAQEK